MRELPNDLRHLMEGPISLAGRRGQHEGVIYVYL